jgi:hypothetical protein
MVHYLNNFTLTPIIPIIPNYQLFPIIPNYSQLFMPIIHEVSKTCQVWCEMIYLKKAAAHAPLHVSIQLVAQVAHYSS